MAHSTTIVAIASPPGAGRRGVLRISGPAARALIAATCRFDAGDALARRGAWRGEFDDGRGTQPVLVLWMPGPHSYTREDVAELHLVGARALLEVALGRLLSLGAQSAVAGEFTRRAFESGRIDLTRAEGVLALVRAASDGERRAATELLFGGLADRIVELREALLGLRVLCEASLDFDEADTGHVPTDELIAQGEAALARLDEATSWEQRRARASALPRIVLAGAPNAGKSTLFNALSGERALVSALAGTTRDFLSGRWVVRGVECELVDTAGLDAACAERTGDPESEAQRFTRATLRSADLVLHVVEAWRAGESVLEVERSAWPPEARTLRVWSQCDRFQARPPGEGVCVSAVTGAGLDQLELAVAGELGWSSAAAPLSSAARELTARHVDALRLARERLSEGLAALRAGAPLDLVAAGVRGAQDALDAIDGRTTPEDVLDALFARFCIGK